MDLLLSAGKHLLSSVQRKELFLLMGVVCLLTIPVCCTQNWVLSVGHNKNHTIRVVELYVSCYLS